MSEVPSSSPDTSISERTDTIRGADDVVNAILKCISNAKYKIDVCIDYTYPWLAIEIKQLRAAFLEQNKRYKNKKHCFQSWTLSFKKIGKRDDFKQQVDTSNYLSNEMSKSLQPR